MMKTHRIALILVAVLVLLALAVPVIGEPQRSIFVDGADVILTPEVGESPPIDVETRVVAAYANDVLRMDLVEMPIPPPVPQRVVVAYSNEILREDLAMPIPLPVPQRVVAAYANEILRADLAPMPTVPLVPQRVVAAYANEILRFELVYPLGLINDPTPPIIYLPPKVIISSGSTVTVTWTTDEFADSWVLYGEEPDQYGSPEGNDTLVKEHEIGLTGLISETTYYYRVRSTDRSGNTATSPEYSFEVCAERYVYLPLVLRDSP